MRCFIAIELDEPVRAALADVLAARAFDARGVRAVDPAQLHITLKFLGDSPSDSLDPIREAAAAAATSLMPFSLRLAGLGAFPSPAVPRILWCGVDDALACCARWLAAADSRLAELGFEPETRPYRPHVTLARSKSADGSAALRRALQSVPAPPSLEWIVRSLTLFESRLSRAGPEYTLIASIPLLGA